MADQERDVADVHLRTRLVDDDEVLAQSMAIDAAKTSPCTSGSTSQYDDGQVHQPIPGSKDKGKTPARESPDTLLNRPPPDNGGPSSEPISEAVGAEPEDGSHRVTSPKTCVDGEQFQPQKQKATPESAKLTSTITALNASEGSGAQHFQPPQYGEPGWEKSAGRPPKKLPILFKDAVGRKFAFPWEKAKTWAGIEHLIQTCFNHVPIIKYHVDAGHYDLFTTSLPIPTPVDAGSQTGPQPVSPPAETPPSSGPPPPEAPTPPPIAPSTPGQQGSTIFILPELWEDLIEPGMFVSMQMWPMDVPTSPPPPLAPPFHPPGPPVAPGFAGGRGRGAGRGRGIGIVPYPPRPLGWVPVEPPKPRGKTRKRQDGL